MKVFLDTSVILEMLRGGQQLQRLLDREDIELHISPIVLQELMAFGDRVGHQTLGTSLKKLLEVVELDTMTAPLWTDIKEHVPHPERLHANDLLNLQHAAMTCDVFLTRDVGIQRAGPVMDLVITDPETFLRRVEEETP